MQEHLQKVIEQAVKLGATYADLRYIMTRIESIKVKNKVVEIRKSEDAGAGLRVIAGDAWGFAASADLSEEGLIKLAEEAVAVARASAAVQEEPVVLDATTAIKDIYRTPVKIHPADVPLSEKIDLLLAANREILSVPGVNTAESSMMWRTQEKLFLSSEGAEITQTITECGAGVEAVALSNGDIQRRSFPTSFGGNFATAGYEFIEAMQLKDNGKRLGKEAVELLSSPACPDTVTDIILDSSQMALQIHESCGHPAELDRVLGMEAGYAGTSFLTLEKLGNFRYGSPIVNICADATVPGGLGTFGYDDEGVPASRFMLVKNGIFCGYLTSRETAAKFGLKSNGCMRAETWQSIPLIRMTNINLEPGDWTLEEIIRDTRDGLFLLTNSSWSIDDKRLNFQFGTEIAYEVKNGTLGRILKNPTYAGITPEFWNSCDAIAGADEWVLWGIPACGKGEPCQIAHVGHGAAPARFRKVKVGIG